MQREPHLWIFVAAVLSTSCAYPTDGDCDPDQYYAFGFCRAEAPLSTGAGGAGGAAPDFVWPDGYGAPCTEDASCTAPTDLCAKPPGDVEGLCTSSGCSADPDCPEGLTCVDLGIAGVPTYCGR